MLDFALNRQDGKIVFKKNAQGFSEFWFINGRDRVAQKIAITLRMWFGEWFLEQTRGMPYLETIFVKGTRLSTIETIIKTQILSVEGVNGIDTFVMELNRQTRVLLVNFTCNTSEGLVRNSITLDANR
jgi:hypothetical protein